MSPQELDKLILSFVTDRFQKTAMVIAKVFFHCGLHSPVGEDDIGARVYALVHQGKLEALGDLTQWRFSEVPLPNSARTKK